MASYKVELRSSAEKDLRSLDPQIVTRVARAIDSLSQAPRPRGAQQLAGRPRRYRFRVGDYRILYDVDHKTHLVDVARVAHRREAYRKR